MFDVLWLMVQGLTRWLWWRTAPADPGAHKFWGLGFGVEDLGFRVEG